MAGLPNRLVRSGLGSKRTFTMSANGSKRTFRGYRLMSAFDPKWTLGSMSRFGTGRWSKRVCWSHSRMAAD